MDQVHFFKNFIDQHRLPLSYQQLAETYFVPLAQQIVQQQLTRKQRLLVGINGSQGSGKTTLSQFLVAYLSQVLNCTAVAMSIDDFYLTKAERKHLSRTEHPLLLTRGVPGTHDIELMAQTINTLLTKEPPFSVPRFFKEIDDRAPIEQWVEIEQTPKVVILEGWCVGCPSQPEVALIEPVNSLEANEDSKGRWRLFANRALEQYQQMIFSQFDQLIMLKAPGFHVVKQWRLEQEEKLMAALNENQEQSEIMNAEQIERFIAHYQRISEFGFLAIPQVADVVFELNEQREIYSANTAAPN